MKSIFLRTGMFFLVLAAWQFLSVNSALAVDITCFCSRDIERITVQNFKDAKAADKEIISWCHPIVSVCNTDSVLPQTGARYDECVSFSGAAAYVDCKNMEAKWMTVKIQKLKEVYEGAAPAGGIVEPSSSGAFSRIIPDCVLRGETTGECGNVNIFLTTLLNVAHYLFGIIGALALAMFVYGGFVLIMSEGSPEKVKHGTGIMAAAVIGLLIAFGAYLLVQFLQEAVGFNEANL